MISGYVSICFGFVVWKLGFWDLDLVILSKGTFWNLMDFSFWRSGVQGRGGGGMLPG